MSDQMVKAENVCKSFGHVEVLKGIDLEVAPKAVFCLVGPSGSGKSSVVAAGIVPALRAAAAESSEPVSYTHLTLPTTPYV